MGKPKKEIKSGAKFSPCRKYRYSLWREWDEHKEVCVFIGLNPSNADEKEDDQTTKRCIQFAKSWGFGKVVMINLFAIRTIDPDMILSNDFPVGAENDHYIHTEANKAGLVVAAWGNGGSILERSKEVLEALDGVELKCFKITKDGQPAHPLYQSANSELVPLNYLQKHLKYSSLKEAINNKIEKFTENLDHAVSKSWFDKAAQINNQIEGLRISLSILDSGDHHV